MTWRPRKARRCVRFMTTRYCSPASRSRLVLAEDWETACFAASLVRIEYEKDDFETDIEAARDEAFVVEKPEKPRGDAAKAFAAAQVKHEAEYFVPTEYHNPMELFAATAMWEGGGRLTVYDKTQGVQNVQKYLCSIFGKKSDELRVMYPYMGGGFGAGLRPQYECVLATLGALALRRSVRVVLTRQQMYGLGYRPATIERLALGAKAGRHSRFDEPRGDRDNIAATRNSRVTTPAGADCSTRART